MKTQGESRLPDSQRWAAERDIAITAFKDEDFATLYRLWKLADEDRESRHAAFSVIVDMYAEKKASSPHQEAIAAIERVAKDAVTLAREFVSAMAGKGEPPKKAASK